MKSERQQDDLGGFCSEHGARGTELGLPVVLLLGEHATSMIYVYATERCFVVHTRMGFLFVPPPFPQMRTMPPSQVPRCSAKSCIVLFLKT